MAASYTPRQGRYLSFVHWYTKLNGRPPAEADIQSFFQASPSSVHQMIVSLENKGLIERTPHQARTIVVLLPSEEIPDLDTGEPPFHHHLSPSKNHPMIEEWIQHGYVEIGYDHNTGTFARAIDEGGMLWGGGHRHMSLEEALRALEIALMERTEIWR